MNTHLRFLIERLQSSMRKRFSLTNIISQNTRQNTTQQPTNLNIKRRKRNPINLRRRKNMSRKKRDITNR